MSTGEQLTVERLRSFGSAEFQQLLEIYREAIPESERKGVIALRAMLEMPQYVLLVAKIGVSVFGFSIVKEFAGTHACLLEYMAVARDERGRGIGRSLFTEASASTDRFMLLEVDSDRREAPNRAIRTKRKNFYRDLGCREVEGLRFAMPSVTDEAPPEMDLLVFKRDMPREMDKKQIQEWLECIYAEVYGERTDDGRIDAMLADLPDKVQLI